MDENFKAEPAPAESEGPVRLVHNADGSSEFYVMSDDGTRMFVTPVADDSAMAESAALASVIAKASEAGYDLSRVFSAED